MMLSDFVDRANECWRLATRTHSPHDQELFELMARAWAGQKEEAGQDSSHPERPH